MNEDLVCGLLIFFGFLFFFLLYGFGLMCVFRHLWIVT